MDDAVDAEALLRQGVGEHVHMPADTPRRWRADRWLCCGPWLTSWFAPMRLRRAPAAKEDKRHGRRVAAYALAGVLAALAVGLLGYAVVVPWVIQRQINRADLNTMHLAYFNASAALDDGFAVNLKAELPPQMPLVPVTASIAPVQLRVIEEGVPGEPVLLVMGTPGFEFPVHRRAELRLDGSTVTVPPASVDAVGSFLERLSHAPGLKPTRVRVETDLQITWLGITWYRRLPVYRHFDLPAIAPNLMSVYEALPSFFVQPRLPESAGNDSLASLAQYVRVRHVRGSLDDNGAHLRLGAYFFNPTVASFDAAGPAEFGIRLEGVQLAVVRVTGLQLHPGHNNLLLDARIDMTHPSVEHARAAGALSAAVSRAVEGDGLVNVAISGPLILGRATGLASATRPLRLRLPLEYLTRAMDLESGGRVFTPGGMQRVFDSLDLSAHLGGPGAIRAAIGTRLPLVVALPRIVVDYPISLSVYSATDGIDKQRVPTRLLTLEVRNITVHTTSNATLARFEMVAVAAAGSPAASEMGITVNRALRNLTGVVDVANVTVLPRRNAPEAFAWTRRFFGASSVRIPVPRVPIEDLLEALTDKGSRWPVALDAITAAVGPARPVLQLGATLATTADPHIGISLGYIAAKASLRQTALGTHNRGLHSLVALELSEGLVLARDGSESQLAAEATFPPPSNELTETLQGVLAALGAGVGLSGGYEVVLHGFVCGANRDGAVRAFEQVEVAVPVERLRPLVARTVAQTVKTFTAALPRTAEVYGVDVRIVSGTRVSAAMDVATRLAPTLPLLKVRLPGARASVEVAGERIVAVETGPVEVPGRGSVALDARLADGGNGRAERVAELVSWFFGKTAVRAPGLVVGGLAAGSIRTFQDVKLHVPLEMMSAVATGLVDGTWINRLTPRGVSLENVVTGLESLEAQTLPQHSVKVSVAAQVCNPVAVSFKVPYAAADVRLDGVPVARASLAGTGLAIKQTDGPQRLAADMHIAFPRHSTVNAQQSIARVTQRVLFGDTSGIVGGGTAGFSGLVFGGADNINALLSRVTVDAAVVDAAVAALRAAAKGLPMLTTDLGALATQLSPVLDDLVVATADQGVSVRARGSALGGSAAISGSAGYIGARIVRQDGTALGAVEMRDTLLKPANSSDRVAFATRGLVVPAAAANGRLDVCALLLRHDGRSGDLGFGRKGAIPGLPAEGNLGLVAPLIGYAPGETIDAFARVAIPLRAPQLGRSLNVSQIVRATLLDTLQLAALQPPTVDSEAVVLRGARVTMGRIGDDAGDGHELAMRLDVAHVAVRLPFEVRALRVEVGHVGAGVRIDGAEMLHTRFSNLVLAGGRLQAEVHMRYADSPEASAIGRALVQQAVCGTAGEHVASFEHVTLGESEAAAVTVCHEMGQHVDLSRAVLLPLHATVSRLVAAAAAALAEPETHVRVHGPEDFPAVAIALGPWESGAAVTMRNASVALLPDGGIHAQSAVDLLFPTPVRGGLPFVALDLRVQSPAGPAVTLARLSIRGLAMSGEAVSSMDLSVTARLATSAAAAEAFAALGRCLFAGWTRSCAGAFGVELGGFSLGENVALLRRTLDELVVPLPADAFGAGVARHMGQLLGHLGNLAGVAERLRLRVDAVRVAMALAERLDSVAVHADVLGQHGFAVPVRVSGFGHVSAQVALNGIHVASVALAPVPAVGPGTARRVAVRLVVQVPRNASAAQQSAVLAFLSAPGRSLVEVSGVHVRPAAGSFATVSVFSRMRFSLRLGESSVDIWALLRALGVDADVYGGSGFGERIGVLSGHVSGLGEVGESGAQWPLVARASARVEVRGGATRISASIPFSAAQVEARDTAVVRVEAFGVETAPEGASQAVGMSSAVVAIADTPQTAALAAEVITRDGPLGLRVRLLRVGKDAATSTNLFAMVIVPVDNAVDSLANSARTLVQKALKNPASIAALGAIDRLGVGLDDSAQALIVRVRGRVFVGSNVTATRLPVVRAQVVSGRFGPAAAVAVSDVSLASGAFRAEISVTPHANPPLYQWALGDVLGNVLFHHYAGIDAALGKPHELAVRLSAFGPLTTATSKLRVALDVAPLARALATQVDTIRPLELGRLDAGLTPRGIEALLQCVPFSGPLAALRIDNIPSISGRLAYHGTPVLEAGFYGFSHDEDAGGAMSLRAWLQPLPGLADGLALALPRLLRFEDYAEGATIEAVVLRGASNPYSPADGREMRVFERVRVQCPDLYLFRPLVVRPAPRVRGGVGADVLVAFPNTGPLSLDIGALYARITNRRALLGTLETPPIHIHSAHDAGGLSVIHALTRVRVQALWRGGPRAVFQRATDLLSFMTRYRSEFEVRQRGTGAPLPWLGEILDRTPAYLAAHWWSIARELLSCTAVRARDAAFWDILAAPERMAAVCSKRDARFLQQSDGVVGWANHEQRYPNAPRWRPVFHERGFDIVDVSSGDSRAAQWGGTADLALDARSPLVPSSAGNDDDNKRSGVLWRMLALPARVLGRASANATRPLASASAPDLEVLSNATRGPAAALPGRFYSETQLQALGDDGG